MNVLIDTHAFLWFIEGSPRLSRIGVETIRDPGTELYLSIASLWEIAIKASIGRLPLAQPFDVLIPDQLARHDVHILQIDVPHLVQLVSLPGHHRDPFDRILIAQSIVEQLPIVSADPAFDVYAVSRLW